MSQHFQHFMYGDQEALLMAGWDKPTQRVYALFSTLNPDKTDWQNPMLVDIEIPINRKNIHTLNLNNIFSSLQAPLSAYDVNISEQMWKLIQDDIINNSVNSMILHQESAGWKAVQEQPFKSGYKI